MQQFVVPQFIGVEDKVIGPITVRQFILMVIGGVFIFIAFKYTDITLFLFLAVVILILVFLFGFFKVNGLAFHNFLLNIMMSFKKPSLRVWNKKLSDEELQIFIHKPIKKKEQLKKAQKKKMISMSRLAELSLIVDTKGNYKGEQ